MNTKNTSCLLLFTEPSSHFLCGKISSSSIKKLADHSHRGDFMGAFEAGHDGNTNQIAHVSWATGMACSFGHGMPSLDPSIEGDGRTISGV